MAGSVLVMETHEHGGPHEHGGTHEHDVHAGTSLNRMAAAATTHCLTGCAIGEVLGLAIATALGWGNLASIALAIVLAYCFGYALTLRSVLASGIALRPALGIAF